MQLAIFKYLSKNHIRRNFVKW